MGVRLATTESPAFPAFFPDKAGKAGGSPSGSRMRNNYNLMHWAMCNNLSLNYSGIKNINAISAL